MAIEQEIRLGLNLNAAPVVMVQDLNEAPMVQDPQEMLIHPVQGQIPEALVNIPQPIDPQPAVPTEENADNMGLNVEPLPLPVNPQNFLHFKIQQDEIMNNAELLELQND